MLAESVPECLELLGRVVVEHLEDGGAVVVVELDDVCLVDQALVDDGGGHCSCVGVGSQEQVDEGACVVVGDQGSVDRDHGCDATRWSLQVPLIP